MLIVSLCAALWCLPAGAVKAPLKPRIAGTVFRIVAQHPNGSVLVVGPSGSVQFGIGDIELAVSTFQGALAGAGVHGALVETAGKNISVYLPMLGMATTPSYITNALNFINSSATERINLYSRSAENWSEYSISGKSLLRGSKGIGETAFVNLKTRNLQNFTITMLKALSKINSVDNVLIGIQVHQKQDERLVTIEVILKQGGVLPSGFLAGLLVSQTSSQISTFSIAIQ